MINLNASNQSRPPPPTSATYSSLQAKPLKCFESRSAYVEAMKEDLAEWLNKLNPGLDLTSANFFSRLETGSIICRHANYVTNMGRKALTSKLNLPEAQMSKIRKMRVLSFKPDARPGTFFARDNICQFIFWCRSLNIHDCLLFETDDLVARKNERSFILCMLEVARIGFGVGVETPLIIQLEQEIDREIENEAKQRKFNQLLQESIEPSTRNHQYENDDNKLNYVKLHQDDDDDSEMDADYGPKPQVITNDLMSLHEKVVQLLCECTCPTQFPMVRVGDNGKYKVGDKLIIFVRILRRHIMVRVGGGWQELGEFLRAKDPCRMRSTNQHCNNNPQTNCQQQSSLDWTTNATSTIINNQQHCINTGAQRMSNESSSSSLVTIVNNNHQADNDVYRSHNNNNRNTHNGYNCHPTRSISGSASMSWLSHNSRC